MYLSMNWFNTEIVLVISIILNLNKNLKRKNNFCTKPEIKDIKHETMYFIIHIDEKDDLFRE